MENQEKSRVTVNSINAELMFMKLVAGRLKIEFAYYSLVNNEMAFNDVVC